MQHLDNDIEDLFKRAGENYSPQKGKGDWEGIARRISDNSNIQQGVVLPVRNNRKRIIIVLLLLLFIISVCLFLLKDASDKLSFVISPDQFQKEAREVPRNRENNKHNDDLRKRQQPPTFFAGQNLGEKQKIKKAPSSLNTAPGKTIAIDYVSYIKFNSHDPLKADWKKGSTGLAIYSEDHSSQRFMINVPENHFSDSQKYQAEILQKYTGDNIIPATDDTAGTVKKMEKPPLVTRQKKKGLYFGAVAAPDFSNVHSSSFDNTGFNAGLLIGFKVSKRLSFESGLVWNKKMYRSEGKNFSMDKIYSAMPVGMVINTMEGKSSLIEIPVKIRYGLAQKTNSEIFIGGGVSSYIVTKEKNVYHVSMNGIGENISGIYKKNNYEIPATVDVSVGYGHRIYKNVAVRIEPFLKIPLQGIGVGSLAVTSIGLQLGIISRFK